MLFNSFAFLFLFLPLVLAGYFWLGRLDPRWAAGWLALASLFFYGYWEVRYLPLLLASITFNYWCGQVIGAALGTARRRCLQGAIGLNLLLLAYYKYANFLVDSVNLIGQAGWEPWHVVLPIGISFFTFTQIAFLVDSYHAKVKQYRFIDYLLFVSYFPHLIAGPVLHHNDMMPQFAEPANYRPSAPNFAIGLSIFVLGLAKKMLIADNLAPMASPVFAPGAEPQLIEAWVGVLAYTFQLYFDFSGYSDMAIGLSRLFGVRLPLNFNSPYKAANISQFWRCWHMSLSRFLRDYLYFPLGGSRDGRARRYRNLMLTMLLGGLWHGAGWTFVIWGGLHGLYLVLHQVWDRLAAKAAFRAARGWVVFSRAVTFGAVMLGWVFFRAPDTGTALGVLAAMAGRNGISLPSGMAKFQGLWHALGLRAEYHGIATVDVGGPGLPMLAAAILIAFLAPNTQEIFDHYEPCSDRIFQLQGKRSFRWRPAPGWSLVFVLLFFSCLLSMNRVTEFLYFQF